MAICAASSKGLGFATALALGEEGVKVVINGRDPATLAEAAAKISSTGATVYAFPGDITKPEFPGQLVRAAFERFGRLDIAVANAGGPPSGGSLSVSELALKKAMDDNLFSSIRLIKVAFNEMRVKNWGRIVAISSYSIKQPIPSLSLSNTARTGLWAWMKTAAKDITTDYPGITLNMVCPGIHETDRIKELKGDISGPIGNPLDFGKVVSFLCSQQAKFINGAAIVVDGGETLAL